MSDAPAASADEVKQQLLDTAKEMLTSGLVQGTAAAESSWHITDGASASSVEKWNCAVATGDVIAGWPVIISAGAIVSTVNEYVGTEAVWSPAVARASNACMPSVSAATVSGDVHAT